SHLAALPLATKKEIAMSFNATLDSSNRRLTLQHGDEQQQFAALWLRENAPDEHTRDPLTSQRLIDSALLPTDITITRLHCDAARLELTFSDGHATVFDPQALLQQGESDDALAERMLWDSSSLEQVPDADYAAAVADDKALGVMLEQLRCFGFVR